MPKNPTGKKKKKSGQFKGHKERLKLKNEALEKKIRASKAIVHLKTQNSVLERYKVANTS